MNTYVDPTAMPVRTANANIGGTACAKALALEATQTVSRTAKDALLAYVMTGSALASFVVIAAPHFEVVLRCIFQGRG